MYQVLETFLYILQYGSSPGSEKSGQHCMYLTLEYDVMNRVTSAFLTD